MRRFLPQSLAGQTILVLLIGLTVSHAISMVIYSGDRGEALSILGGRHMAQRIANIAHMVAEFPPTSRRRIVAGLNDNAFRVSLSPESELVIDADIGWRARIVRTFVESRLRRDAVRQVMVQMLNVDEGGPVYGPGGPGWRMGMHMMEMFQGTPQQHALRISIQLADGQWINFASPIPGTDPFWSTTSVFSMISMIGAVILLSVWVVRRLTRPLGTFAAASERLGRDVNAAPLPETGPAEVRRAAQAFNEMQARLKRFINNRTHMLAAISHDLRTPITRLRLRAELIDDGEERAKMLGTLDEMEKMIASTLAFARGEAEGEETRRVDLEALLESICDDMTEAGSRVELIAPQKVLYGCRPTAIKRAFTNLIDNAVKYGGCARVQLETGAKTLTVTVEDDGPGIPREQMEQVFAPFFRVEQSRNPHTGGTGLGLSVAQTVVHAHGGEIKLENRQAGGLRVSVTLPI